MAVRCVRRDSKHFITQFFTYRNSSKHSQSDPISPFPVFSSSVLEGTKSSYNVNQCNLQRTGTEECLSMFASHYTWTRSRQLSKFTQKSFYEKTHWFNYPEWFRSVERGIWWMMTIGCIFKVYACRQELAVRAQCSCSSAWSSPIYSIPFSLFLMCKCRHRALVQVMTPALSPALLLEGILSVILRVILNLSSFVTFAIDVSTSGTYKCMTAEHCTARRYGQHSLLNDWLAQICAKVCHQIREQQFDSF